MQAENFKMSVGQRMEQVDGGMNAGGGGCSSLHEWDDEQWAKAREMIRGTNKDPTAPNGPCRDALQKKVPGLSTGLWQFLEVV